jgi:spore coat-associated protein N
MFRLSQVLARAPHPALAGGIGRRGITGLVVTGLAIAAVGSSALSLAIFTDSDTSSGSFTAGTIDIATTPATLFTVVGVMPGDSGSATLTVANSGTAQLRYAMTSSSTNTDGKALRDQLQLSIKTGTCPGSGTALLSGAFSAAALGDVSQGSQTGDRTLNAASNDPLCFAWSLPLATGNAFQGAATTTTFTFAAEQTANN